MLEQILYTACVTPFDKTGDNVDYDSLEKLLRLQESAGNGVLLLGSTGESLSLTDKERKDIVTFACGLKLNTEIVVGVPSYNLSAALDFIDFCNDFPVNGYLMTTPIYTKPGVMGQSHWFARLLDKAEHPAILYNIPGRAGVRLHTETVKNLESHTRFLAIKDSSGTVESTVDYKIAAPNIAIYCGDDYMMPSAAIEGAIGLMSVASNAWPVAVRKYVKDCTEGKKIKTKIWWKAGRDLFTASNPIPIKALLKDIGIIKNDTVRLPLSLSDLPSREVLLSYHAIISMGI
jgi:4-hydroxy-tetrahydrodipicolinate synthase